ncbi:AI-2E family transporter [Dokdonia sinensis]|uniref:AI-2E family transporter n=1 Tax=Dokdonia sinensis TaxID=2479847 RepID=A0A3M0G3J8_9FLAO|nr:AI-2E family transporter [Dokdonia sinensis]RMB59494.1 AI-2E family transporter [Dokdonia sinensis]
MNSKAIAYGILRALGILAGIFFLLWFLYEIQSVLVYLAVAAVISLIGRPITIFLKRRLKMGDTWAAITTILFVFLFIAGVLTLFIPVIIDQSAHLSNIDFNEVKVSIDRLYGEIAEYFGVSRTTIIRSVQESNFIKDIDFGIIPSFLNGIIGNLGAALIGIFSVIFITFFFLKDSRLLVSSILVFANRGNEGKFLRVFEKIKYLLSRYFIGLLLQVFIMFVLYSIILNFFSVENAFAVALFCATLNLVPYLGPLVGGGVMLLLATSSNLDADFQTVILPNLIYISICYGFAQLIDNFILQPKIFGNSVKSHPLEVFLAIIIAGLLFGVIGMVLAIPTYTAIKVISNEFLSEYKIVQNLTRDL